MMLVNGASDPFLYRTFLTFLEKAALLWFSSLPARTIHNFAELSQALVNQFSLSRVYKKTSDALNAIRQGSQEPLGEYLNQFNTVAMQMDNLDLAVELHSIKGGLWVGPFIDSLAINPSRSLTELRDRAIRYINIEEVWETRKAEVRMENGKADEIKQDRRN